MNELEMFVIAEVAMLDQLEAMLYECMDNTPCQCEQAAIERRIRRVERHRNMLLNWQNRQHNEVQQ